LILLGPHGINVLVNFAQINGNTLEHNLVGLDQIAFQIGVAQVERVCRTSHTRAIGVPVEQIEGGRLLAQQIVVDHIAPDQVVGAQHVEHTRHRTAIQVAALHHTSLKIGYLRLINKDRGVADLAKILQGDKERYG